MKVLSKKMGTWMAVAALGTSSRAQPDGCSKEPDEVDIPGGPAVGAAGTPAIAPNAASPSSRGQSWKLESDPTTCRHRRNGDGTANCHPRFGTRADVQDADARAATEVVDDAGVASLPARTGGWRCSSELGVLT
jgi:hypothetical protein